MASINIDKIIAALSEVKDNVGETEISIPATKSSSPSELAKEVMAAYEVFTKQNEFKIGQLVTWKDRMQNRTKPDYGQPAIIVEIFSKPKVDTTKSAGSPYFDEPLDLRLGFIDDDGDFMTLLFDSRRFRPYIETELSVQ